MLSRSVAMMPDVRVSTTASISSTVAIWVTAEKAESDLCLNGAAYL